MCRCNDVNQPEVLDNFEEKTNNFDENGIKDIKM